jgi:hypothetical protein
MFATPRCPTASINNVGGVQAGFLDPNNQVVEVGRNTRTPDNCTAIWLIFLLNSGYSSNFLKFFAEILSFFAKSIYLIMK